MFRIERLTVKPLSVPLTSPFVIASARVDVTPNVLAANVAAALGGVEYPDLDTALLLATDPFSGGYVMTGARLELARGPGLDLRPA